MLRFLILLLIIPYFLFAQQTKKVVKKKDKYAPKEIYYVLKSDTSVKEGPYSLLDSYTGEPLTTGYFHENKKDSVWVNYKLNKKVKSQGYYKNDVKVGVWSYYNYKDELEQEYDHTMDSLLYLKNKEAYLNKEAQVLEGNDTILRTVDCVAIYIGGQQEIGNFLVKKLRYPREAEKKGISGKVIVLITIDEQGKASDYKVQTNFGGGLEEESLRVAKELPNEWKPAILNGKAVKSFYPLTLVYKLPE